MAVWHIVRAMDLYVLVKTLHVVSSTVLFGTGVGIAFFMLRSRFADDLEAKVFAARNTVLADTLFTLPAAVLQPVTGILLVQLGGHDWSDLWLTLSVGLFVIVGLCWLPVVWIQIRIRAILVDCAGSGAGALPASYDRLFRIWTLLGCPAFLGLIVVFYLMVAKPI